jgi:hypothetical protein
MSQCLVQSGAANSRNSCSKKLGFLEACHNEARHAAAQAHAGTAWFDACTVDRAVLAGPHLYQAQLRMQLPCLQGRPAMKKLWALTQVAKLQL